MLVAFVRLAARLGVIHILLRLFIEGLLAAGSVQVVGLSLVFRTASSSFWFNKVAKKKVPDSPRYAKMRIEKAVLLRFWAG